MVKSIWILSLFLFGWLLLLHTLNANVSVQTTRALKCIAAYIIGPTITLNANVSEQTTGTRSVELSSSVKLEMIWVEPGTFTMGQEGYERVHEVTLTKGFYFGKYELTNAQY